MRLATFASAARAKERQREESVESVEEEEEKPAEGGRERAGEELVGANYIYLI